MEKPMQKPELDAFFEHMLAEPKECNTQPSPAMRAALAARVAHLGVESDAGVLEAERQFLHRVRTTKAPVPAGLITAAADYVGVMGPSATVRVSRLRRGGIIWVSGAIAAAVLAILTMRPGDNRFTPTAVPGAAPGRTNVLSGRSDANDGRNVGPGVPHATATKPSESVYTAPNPPRAITSHAVTATDYPPESVARQEQGMVRIQFLIAADGTVGQCGVTNSSGFPLLDDAACRLVVARWRYRPASLLDGTPVSFWMPAAIVFQLGAPPPANGSATASGP